MAARPVAICKALRCPAEHRDCPPGYEFAARVDESRAGGVCWAAVEDGLQPDPAGALREVASPVREGELPRVTAAFAIPVISIVRLLRTQAVQPKMIHSHAAPDEMFCRLGVCHA